MSGDRHLTLFTLLSMHLNWKIPNTWKLCSKHTVVTVSVPDEEQGHAPRATPLDALTDSTVASQLPYLLLPLVLSPWWPIKKHRQAYSWTLVHKGHLSNPIMEQLHLGNTQYNLRTENKEPVKVCDTVHQSATHYRKCSEACDSNGKYMICW